MAITNKVRRLKQYQNIGYYSKCARSYAKANMSDRDLEKSPTPGKDKAPSDGMADEREAIEDTVDEEVEEEQSVELEHSGEEEIEESSTEEVVEDPKLAAKKKKQNLIKRVMEYDLTEMYPEMSVLTEKKRSEWDYQDPETIRALWLESKTNVLSEWKVRYLTIKKSRKPQIEVRDTTAHTLRVEHLKNKEENEKNAEQKDLQMIEKGRESPKFDEVKLPTNTTTDMRYKYTRNNPPVPRYYIEHFNKHKKPPFKIHGFGLAGCKP